MADQKIQFLEYQKPSLESGNYKLTVEQTLDIPKQLVKPFSGEVNFAVIGERFVLDSSKIHAVYPPAGSLGRFNDCLPHLAIKRSTFPWERSAYGREDNEPWLALILFDEKEIRDGDVTTTRTITLEDLVIGNKGVEFPDTILETGQHSDDKINVIDVKKGLMENILPSGDELRLLAHVRKRVDKDQEAPETELAVIMTNRLPKEGSGSTMHLVSMENRYNEKDKTFDFGKAQDNDYIRLVSLKSWSFTSLPREGKDFEELVQSLSTDVLKLPMAHANVAQPYLSKGYVPLKHTLRQSDKTFSWYHGPLSTTMKPSEFDSDNDIPLCADELICYHQDTGMFDTSYATAFELGRTLALDDDNFSTALYQWKYQYNENVCFDLEQVSAAHLTGTKEDSKDKKENNIERTIKNWFSKLNLLHEVPFNYLVADEKMLPTESIRFFKIDNHWLECLLNGAFTIGGDIRKRKKVDSDRIKCIRELMAINQVSDRSGFILRSQLVVDYPDLMIDAYSKIIDTTSSLEDADIVTKLPVLRIEKLGADIMICLFEGNLSTAEIYLKPEGLHMGLDEESGKLKKELTTEYIFNAINNQLPEEQKIAKPKLANLMSTIDGGSLFSFEEYAQDKGAKFEFPVHFKSNEDFRVIDIFKVSKQIHTITCRMAVELTQKTEKELLDNLKTETGAQFGMHMIEGSNKGRFVVKSDRT